MTLQLSLDDMLAELRHCRRRNDLGRIALIVFCDVRRWARLAGEFDIAERSGAMFAATPRPNREAFLQEVDSLISDLERAGTRFVNPGRNEPAAQHSPA